jgi:hypothetical protein
MAQNAMLAVSLEEQLTTKTACEERPLRDAIGNPKASCTLVAPPGAFAAVAIDNQALCAGGAGRGNTPDGFEARAVARPSGGECGSGNSSAAQTSSSLDGARIPCISTPSAWAPTEDSPAATTSSVAGSTGKN